MFRIFLLTAFIVSVFILSGCKEKQPAAEDYKAEAQKQITPENLDEELEKMEQQIQQDETAIE